MTEKTIEWIDSLIEERKEEKARIDKELEALFLMKERATANCKIKPAKAPTETEVKKTLEKVEYLGGNLTRIVKDILRILPPGQQFDKDFIADKIKQERPDLYPQGSKQRSSFYSVFWKAAREMELSGDVVAVERAKGRGGNLYRKI